MENYQLCPGLNCPIKSKCHRSLAKKEEVNYFFTDLPYDFEFRSCQFYIPAKFR